jgi:hypothetical protein
MVPDDLPWAFTLGRIPHSEGEAQRREASRLNPNPSLRLRVFALYRIGTVSLSLKKSCRILR